jgi:hypothetical protein
MDQRRRILERFGKGNKEEEIGSEKIKPIKNTQNENMYLTYCTRGNKVQVLGSKVFVSITRERKQTFSNTTWMPLLFVSTMHLAVGEGGDLDCTILPTLLQTNTQDQYTLQSQLHRRGARCGNSNREGNGI